MIKRSDGKIGAREFTSLIIMVMAIKAADMTPVTLFKQGITATWMFPIIWAAVMIGPFLLTLRLLKAYQDKNIIEITNHLVGKYIGFIINMTFVVILLSATVLNSRSYTDIVKAVAFPRTPLVYIHLLAFIGIFLVANRGLEGMGRISYLLLPYIKIVLLFLVFFVWGNLDWGYLYPLQGPGITKVIKNGINTSTLVAEFMVFAVIFPYVRNYRDYKISSFLGFGIALVEISFFLALYVALFDYPAIGKISFPFHQTARLVRVAGFISNVEGLVLATWIIAAIIRFAFYVYGLAATFSYAVGLKEFEPLILPISTVVFLLGLIPDNPIVTILIFRSSILIRYSWYIFFIVPILFWVMAWRKGELKS